MYDPGIGRFTAVDALASQSAEITPYHFAMNNPVNANDPSGLYTSWYTSYMEHYMQGVRMRSMFDDEDYSNWEKAMNRMRGPGSGNYWTDQYRSMKMNFGLMSTSTFESFYGVDLSNDQDRAAIADALGSNSQEALASVGLSIVTSQSYDPSVSSAGMMPVFGLMSNGTFLGNLGPDFFADQNWECSTCPNDPNTLDPSTLGINLFGLHYPGGNNPQTYPDENGNRKPDYTTPPKSLAGYPAIGHDRRYDNLKIAGAPGLFFDTRAIGADWQFVKEELSIASTPYLDPVTRLQSGILGIGLGLSALGKTIIGFSTPQSTINVIVWYHISNIGVTNLPSKNK